MKSHAPRLRGNLEERLLARLRFSDGCWVWRGCVTKGGYGRLALAGRRDWVHRFVAEWCLGRKLKRNEHVDHLCRTRACSRPSHLEVVTPRENTRRGAVAKLSAEEVEELKNRRSNGEPVKSLALAFGVHYSHVSKICNGHRWNNR